MSNEIVTRQMLPPGTPTVQQTGEKNLNVTNNKGGIVNINYNFTQNGTVNSTEKMMAVQAFSSAEAMMAIQNFSKEYYQLLVTCEEDVFEKNIIIISTNRALRQDLVPPKIYERCSSLSDEGIKELKTFPAIICRENDGACP